MIGYDEHREASMLLELVLQSRTKLRQFNLTDDQIAGEMKCDAADAAAVAAARAQWYAGLARWAIDARQQGQYALCFNASQVQRKPYDLLASLPLTEKETELASDETLPDALLKGLTGEEKLRARRLYHRLLCIQPMRLLLDRLLQLEEALAEPEEGKRMAALKTKTAEADFRAPISETMERSSGQRLDLKDNDFTILDRLIANWDRTLQSLPEIVVPADVISSAANEQTLLTAAVVYGSRGCVPEGSYAPYRAVSGGHVALGVYADGAPEKLFEAVTSGQKKGAGRVLRVRGYAGTKLVQLSDEAYDAFRKAKFSRNAVGEAAGKRADGFCALDDGGKRLLPLLRREIEARRALQEEPWLERMLKGEKLKPAQQDRALSMLQECAADFFAQRKLPCRLGDYVEPVLSRSRNLGIRAVRLLLADVAGDELVYLACPEGQTPEMLCRHLASMKADRKKLAGFLSKAAALKKKSVRLDLCYTDSAPRTLAILRTDEAAYAGVADYLRRAAGALASGAFDSLPPPAFTAEELHRACLQGLRHLLVFRRSVGTGNDAFALEGMDAEKKSSKKVEDEVFQLFCLWCVHRLNGGAHIVFTPDSTDVRKTLLTVRNAPVMIVDLIAGKKTETAEGTEGFTPEALHAFLASTVGMRLIIAKAENREEWTVESPA